MKRGSQHPPATTSRFREGAQPPADVLALGARARAGRYLGASAVLLLLAGSAIGVVEGPAAAGDLDWTLRSDASEDPLLLAAELQPSRAGTRAIDRTRSSSIEERVALAKAPAPTPRAPKPLVRYHVYDESVGATLVTLGKLTGIPVSLHGDVEGRLRAETLTGSLGSIVAQLSGRFGFFYAFDGTRFLVSSHENSVTDVTEVPAASFDKAVSLMGKVFPAVSPGSVRVSRDLGVVMLRGPEAFVDAERTALSLNTVDHIKLIRGGYASVLKLGDEDPAPGN